MAEIAEPLFDDEPAPAAGLGKPHLKLFLVTASILVVGSAAGLWLAAFSVERIATHDPQAVRQIAAGIHPALLPAEFAPEAASQLRMRLARTPILAWASFFDKASGSRLVLAFGSDAGRRDPHSKFKVLVEQSLRDQGVGPPWMSVDDTYSLSISAHPAVLMVVARGRSSSGEQQRLQAVAAVPVDETRAVELFFFVDAQRIRKSASWNWPKPYWPPAAAAKWAADN